MSSLSQVNPFAKRELHSAKTAITHKILVVAIWLLALISTVYYTAEAPHDGVYARRSIWHQNKVHPSGFSLNSVIVSIYWIVLFVLQFGYVAHLLFSRIEEFNAAASVSCHFILNNLLHFAFVMLFVRSYFGWAELMLLLNFLNLSILYFRHNAYPRFMHLSVLSGPLAWTFLALYWNGAIMVPHQHSLVARIFANVFVWSILVYGLFFLAVYRDYMMGFNLTVLTAALCVSQFLRQVIALQWIFAFIIMSLLFVLTLPIAFAAWMGRKTSSGRGRTKASTDAERAPLLVDN